MPRHHNATRHAREGNWDQLQPLEGRLLSPGEVLSKRLELAQDMLELVLEESADLSKPTQRQLLTMARTLGQLARGQGRW